jgi:hypothetical protein
VAVKFPGLRVATGFPLGPAEIGGDIRMTHGQILAAARPWRPEVDALVWFNGALLLIEAKVAEYVTGLAKLPFYKSLVPSTPELAQWADWEVRMRLVVPRSKPWVDIMAEQAGVEVDLFEPDWMVEYWEYRDRYWSAEYRTAREDRNRRRAAAGLE